MYNIKTSLDDNKPSLYSGVDVDFNLFSDRKFEEILYHIHKDKIRLNRYIGEFDSIILMPEGSDMGRDSVFLYEGKQVGLIQCKKYKRNINKKEAIGEILKFVLYSFCDPSIFSTGQQGVFHYYFAVSTGFAKGVSEYLLDFSTLIVCEPQLPSLVEAIQNKYPSLSALQYDEIESELKCKLSKIRINLVLPTDIERDLRVDHSGLLSMFFNIEKVIDQEGVNTIVSKIDELSHNAAMADVSNIQQDISSASIHLANITHTFSENEDTYIQRAEVNEVTDWVEQDTPQKQIAILTGIAGCGKSVIMRDVLLYCQSKGYAVLGLKSDRQNAISESALKEKLGFSSSIVDAVRVVMQSNHRVVILIDQIDALSQYLSASRGAIDTYIGLIDKLRSNDKVRIVVSTRKFDLDNDADIHALSKKSKIVSVKDLTDEQVRSVLEKLDILPETLDRTILNLIKNPIHLKLFCDLHMVGSVGATSIKTSYELYSSYLDNRVNGYALRDSLKMLLYELVTDMFEQQDLWVASRRYIDRYSEQVAYLKSQNIVIEDCGQIGFVHQSMYDFIYAKSFVEGGGDLLQYIKENNQLITLRAKVRIILSYLRDYDTPRYIATLTEIICSAEYRFHIKHLAISILSSEQSPKPKEIEIVDEYILNEEQYHKCFFPICTSAVWVKYIFDHAMPHIADFEVVKNVIYTNININTTFVIDYLAANYGSSNQLHNQMSRFLSSLRYWDYQPALDLLDKVMPTINLSDRIALLTARHVLKYDSRFILKRIDWSTLENNSIRIYEANKRFEELIKYEPAQTINLIIDMAEDIYSQEKLKNYNRGYIRTYRDSYYVPDEDDDIRHHRCSADMVIHLLRLIAQFDRNTFIEVYNRIKESDLYLLNLAIIRSLRCSPEDYQQEIVEMIVKAIKYDELGSYEPLHHQYWLLIKESFPLMSQEHKAKIAELIYKYSTPSKCKLLRDGYSVRYPRFYKEWLYLNAIPYGYIETHIELKKRWNELYRKHGKCNNRWHVGVTAARVVGPPLKASAYQYMSHEQWVESLYKYNKTSSIEPGRGLMGGKIEHARSFRDSVKDNPGRFYPLLVQIIPNDQIDMTYKVYGLYGLAEGKYNADVVFRLYADLTSSNLCRPFDKDMMMIYQQLCIDTTPPRSMLEYAINTALNANNESEDEFTLMHSTGTLQGVAAKAIIYSFDLESCADMIFETLHKIAADGLKSSKLSILRNVHYLNNIDQQRAFELFMACVDIVNDQTVMSLRKSIPYYAHNFDRLTNFYTEAINTCTEDENKRALIIYISHAWLKGEPSAKKLLDVAINRWGSSVSAAIIDVGISNILSADYRDKCLKLLDVYLDYDDEEVRNAYSSAFINKEDVDLMILLPFIDKYVVSESFDAGDNYIFDYLFSQSKRYSAKVLELMSRIDYSQRLSDEYEYSNNKKVRIILGIINSTRTISRYNIVASDIFDKMLKSAHNYNYMISDLDSSMQ